ncbi:MAG: endonuclease V [Bacteroidota bacterium]
MLLAFDAHYTDQRTKLVGAVFHDWTDAAPAELRTWTSGPAAAYQPGQFYRRELPLILDALKDFNLSQLQAIIIDGYVYLDGNGRQGLGGHLYTALKQQVPVVGIAKSYFRDTNAAAVLRGKSNKPLYVTAYGMDQAQAAALVRGMAGPYRMPDILAAVDQATKRRE